MATQGTTTVDFGTTPIAEKTFAIVDATLAGLTYAEAWAMSDSTAGNNTTHHRMFNGLMTKTCSISGTTLTVVCESEFGLVTDTFSLRYVAN